MSTVSICIPTYNGAQYLEACLDSVLNQTYRNIEILLVDDQSTDNTVEIIKRYAAIDNRIRLVKNKQNLGLVGNWNRCIELAGGEWIKFVFQDDLISKNCIERMLGVASIEHPLIFCRRDFFFEDNIDFKVKNIYLNIHRFDEFFPKTGLISPTDISKTILKTNDNFFGEPTSSLIHKSIFDHFGLFNNNLIQICDLEFWIRVSTNIGINFINEPLVKFRVHANSTSSKNHELMLYRTSLLDDLILLHEFAYNPFFESFRQISKQSIPKRNFKYELAEKAYWLKNYGFQLAKNEESIYSNPVIEWKKISGYYPNLISSPYLYFHKIKGWVNTNILWRLKNN